MHNRKKWGCILVLVTGIAISWGVYECKYYYSRWSDYKNSPWAYSRDKHAKLLVGKWKGNFSDPNNVNKELSLEIFVPLTDEERKDKAGKLWKRRAFSTRYKNSFDGIATIASKLGKEEYNLNGWVSKEDFHQFRFSFQAADEQKRILSNFAALAAETGSWTDNEMTVLLGFGYLNATGSSIYNSADSRHEKKVKVVLKREL